MVVLGIDPGFQFSGFSVIKKEGRKVCILDYGFLKLIPPKELPDRVRKFYDYFDNKIKIYGVTDLSIETPFLGRNPQNFLKLGYLRGILYLLANQHSLKINEFAPRQIKQKLTGFGGAGKDQVSRVLHQLFPLMKINTKFDVTDAIATALCAVWL